MFAGTLAGNMNVGRRNIEATPSALASQGFPVTIEHVGGNCRRRLVLDLTTGHVWLYAPEQTLVRHRKERR